MNNNRQKTNRILSFMVLGFFFKYEQKMFWQKLTRHTEVICLPGSFMAIFRQFEFWIKHYSRVVYKYVYFIHFLKVWIITVRWIKKHLQLLTWIIFDHVWNIVVPLCTNKGRERDKNILLGSRQFQHKG